MYESSSRWNRKAEGTDIREMTDTSQRAVDKLELGAHKAFT